MAKLKLNGFLFNSIRGAVGGFIYRVGPSGDLYVQEKAERKAPLSPKQIAVIERFRLAAAYGNRVKLDPVLAAEYRAFCKSQMQPYQAGVRDFMKPPVVSGIGLEAVTGQPGQVIRITATDDTQVMGVHLAIRHAITGGVIEEGPANLSVIADSWVYTTRSEIPAGTPTVIEATAIDRPGNEGVCRVQHCVGGR